VAENQRMPMEPPEAPETVKWLQWLHHHFAHEGKVIRQAPIAVLFSAFVLAAIFSYFEWTILDDRDLGQIANLQSATTQKDSTIQLLTNRLKSGPTAAENAAIWRPLSNEERSKLTSGLRSLTPHSITVACETLNCKALSDDFVAAFLAAGWKATSFYGGGMDITGRTGIWIDPNADATRDLKQIIEGTTDLKIQVGPDSPKAFESEQIYLVVGIRPF
jgi:hypothetical protein